MCAGALRFIPLEAHGTGQADLKTGKAAGDATVKSGSQPR